MLPELANTPANSSKHAEQATPRASSACFVPGLWKKLQCSSCESVGNHQADELGLCALEMELARSVVGNSRHLTAECVPGTKNLLSGRLFPRHIMNVLHKMPRFLLHMNEYHSNMEARSQNTASKKPPRRTALI